MREKLTKTGNSDARMLGAFLSLAMFFYWASLPPLGVWPLAFIVPVLWAILIRHPLSLKYRYVYAVVFVFWVASIWWVACPHPLTALGMVAMAAVLPLYWMLFLATAKIAVHRFRIPVMVAAPLCWVGCEFLRNHFCGGFSFCALEHALYLQPRFLQIADIGGGYLVAAMIVAVGTAIGTLWPIKEPGPSQEPGALAPGHVNIRGLTPPALGMAILLATAFYGSSRFTESDDFPPIRIAVLQGNIPVTLNPSPDHADKTSEQFRDLTYQAVTGKPALIVWPETVCMVDNLEFRNGAKPEDINLTDESVVENQAGFVRMTQAVNVPLLLGLSTYVFDGKPQPKRLNSALYVDMKNVGPRYDKVRLVMFGEYIPFSWLLPDDFFLKSLCVEATPGEKPVAIPVGGGWAAINICFESTIPHWIREQVLTLKRQDTPPGLLINISNDGWFWFSQQIDQHLATHVFRAIENGLPYVTATNGGFSAIIDERGRIQKIGARGAAEAVVGEVKLAHPNTLYHRIGDWPPFVCLLLVTFFGVVGIATGAFGYWKSRSTG